MASTINASNSGSGGLIQTADASGVLALQTAGTTAVTVDTSQYVGIGTTAPSDHLSVQGATNREYFKIESTFSSSGSEAGIRLKTAGTNGKEYLILNANTEGSLRFYDATAAAERMRIDSSGNVLVGATSGGGKLSITGTGANGWVQNNINSGTASTASIVFTNDNGAVGSILTSGSATTYSTSSDYRLKEDIAPMTDALSAVAALKPVTYKWKVDGTAGQGFIAHELQEIISDCVTGTKDAVDANGNPQYQGVDTSFLVATLTAAIQELKAEFDAYKSTHP